MKRYLEYIFGFSLLSNIKLYIAILCNNINKCKIYEQKKEIKKPVKILAAEQDISIHLSYYTKWNKKIKHIKILTFYCNDKTKITKKNTKKIW